MIRSFARGTTIVCFTLCLCGCLYAQPVPTPVFNAPEIRTGNTAIFKSLSKCFRAEGLNTQIEKTPIAMTTDSFEVWSVAPGPAKPDSEWAKAIQP